MRDPLPDWLANTFCNLEAGHPLRGLLSSSRINAESKCNSPQVELPGGSLEEELFAFSPFEADKQEEARDAAYRENVEGHVSSAIPTEPTPPHLQPGASTNPLLFSTPGCFASVRRSIENSIADGTFQKPLAPVPQQVISHATNMMHPPALPASHLRLDNVNEINHHDEVFQVGHDNPNVYATPGPTFSCSRPVYFDSPTEDPSLSDPLQPESYELDLNAIDFRWTPFLRSKIGEHTLNSSHRP